MASPQELLDRLEVFGTRLGLENTKRLLASLGDPQLELAVVLVAGTNGKGSTAAFLSSISTAAGYRTGLYTSPHLESVRERIRVDGLSISESRLSTVLERVLSAADGSATYFEVLTGAALLEFAEREVELAVLEVGLGGRLDATNATEPLLSVITQIGLDHQEHLGSSLAEIAAEKAGVLRMGAPALAWVSEPTARESLERCAAALPTTLRFVDRECRVGSDGVGPDIELETALRSYRLNPMLAGFHQHDNLALGVHAAEALEDAGWAKIDSRAIECGVAACRWPGRLEWVELGDGRRVLLDGAHNPSAAQALRRYLASRVPEYTLVFGALRDKQVEEMLPLLAGAAGRVVLTLPRSPRATPLEELVPLAAPRAAELFERPQEALARALESGHPVVVCGSLYLVGEARALLRRSFGVPPPAPDVSTFANTPSR